MARSIISIVLLQLLAMVPAVRSFIHEGGFGGLSRFNNMNTDKGILSASSSSDMNGQQEFNMDEMTSFSELNQLSALLGGPNFDSKLDSIETAKTRLWNFVTDKAEKDIDLMCMGQLTGHLMELGGGDSFEEGTTIEEARDIVWELANQQKRTPETRPDGGCSCCQG